MANKVALKEILQERVNNINLQPNDNTDVDFHSEEDEISDNLYLYNQVREVPPEAQKPISGGRLNGMTDINPMWRIKTLTEQFGVCGFNWYYTIDKTWLETGGNGEIAAFVEISLYIKIEGEWSKPIKGIGGSAFVVKEKNGLHTSDECFKMGLTDAISVACKSLGFAADIYFEKDKSKYQTDTDSSDTPPTTPQSEISPVTANKPFKLTEKQINRLHAIRKAAGVDEDKLERLLLKHFNKTSTDALTREEYDFICGKMEEMINQQKTA